ncbi:uncharacterized protein [Amphiura filiformis]|uniref:uncharacterized protein n=1 Tax=Amphiura filiformis TaxID=82378 RepID=UPI003B21C833
MGSPVSPIAVNMFMEWLENQAIHTAPLDCRQRMWKRYVDDILEIVKEGTTDSLTEHLNKVDPTASIKFTYETEKDGQIPFLDTLIIRKPDNTVKLLVYRKQTHTDQYLSFSSHHPLHHKLGVTRTLLDRGEKIITEDEDKIAEENHIKNVLERCGYPKWTMEKVKTDRANKVKNKPNKKDNPNAEKNKCVVIPYIAGVSEKISRIVKKHNISTAMKPHTTIKKMLVHPKDKQEKERTANCVFEIPCKSCPQHTSVRPKDNLASA